MSTHSKGEDIDPKLRWLAIGLILLAILSAAIGLRPHHWPPGSPIFEQASTRLYEILEMEEGHFPAEKIGSNGFLELSSVFVVAFFSLAAYVLIDKFLLNFRLWRTGFRTGRHVVVCGLGPIGLQIVTDYAKGGAGDEKLRVVAIEKEESCPGIGAARRLGAVVVTGDASDPFILKKTCARKARRVFAVSRELKVVFVAFLLDEASRFLLQEGKFAELRARDASLYGSLSQLDPQEREALIGYLQSQVPLKNFEEVA